MDTKSLLDLLSLTGSLFAISSILCYFVQVVRGNSTPNPATWLIWFVIGMLNTVTYFYVVKGNFLQSFVLVVVNSGVLCITFYSFFKGKFAPVGKIESLSLLIALAVGFIWKMTGDPVLANLILQIVYVISFLPTVMGLRERRLKESPLPWALALCPYLAMIAGILIDWSSQHWVALAHPILNGLLGNGLVVYYSVRNSAPVI